MEEKPRRVDDDSSPWHAHVYYAAADRGRAQAFRARLIMLRESGEIPLLLFVGELRDGKMGPHPVPQFEIHFTARLVPVIEGLIRESGLAALVHPLTHDDLADHTSLGRWIGAPIDLDLGVLDPPGINQGFARFGKTDF
jgi:aromatic ring-cleaving dioxygenase